MARVRKLLGTARCLNPKCTAEVPVKQSEDEGAMSFSCVYCDLSVYARPGTQAYRDLAPTIKPAAGGPEPTPAPKASTSSRNPMVPG